jgi:hypothetical protein
MPRQYDTITGQLGPYDPDANITMPHGTENDGKTLATDIFEKPEATCKHCYGRGTEADYVGYAMTCVEVDCSFCGGTGKPVQMGNAAILAAEHLPIINDAGGM